jgi:GNAT superfamily N-acetyltransferase
MKQDIKLTYRLIKSPEADYVYDMVVRIFNIFVAPAYTQAGIDTFLSMLSADFFKVTTPDQFTIIAENNNKIYGVVSIFNKNHIALLFVDPDMQKTGVGKILIQKCIEKCKINYPAIRSLTVSSSPNSLSFYKNSGFKVIEEEKNENGMRFTPMEKFLID